MKIMHTSAYLSNEGKLKRTTIRNVSQCFLSRRLTISLIRLRIVQKVKYRSFSAKLKHQVNLFDQSNCLHKLQDIAMKKLLMNGDFLSCHIGAALASRHAEYLYSVSLSKSRIRISPINDKGENAHLTFMSVFCTAAYTSPKAPFPSGSRRENLEVRDIGMRCEWTTQKRKSASFIPQKRQSNVVPLRRKARPTKGECVFDVCLDSGEVPCPFISGNAESPCLGD